MRRVGVHLGKGPPCSPDPESRRFASARQARGAGSECGACLQWVQNPHVSPPSTSHWPQLARLGCLGGQGLPENLGSRLGSGAAPPSPSPGSLGSAGPGAPTQPCPRGRFRFCSEAEGNSVPGSGAIQAGDGGKQGRRGFLMESCRRSQRCRDSPTELCSRLPPRSPPQRGPSPFPPTWGSGERGFPAPQDLRGGGTGRPGCAAGIFWWRAQQREGQRH